jgi:hypothetical protein
MTVTNRIMAHFNIYVKCLHDVQAVFPNLTCELRVRSVTGSRMVVVGAFWEGARVAHCI